ncbi:hypothetical protein HN011_010944 [Eciton burchellii]|nr:hypothetical protein HN011_010944 [Eciton burchellii]
MSRLLFLPAGGKYHMLPTGELLVFSVTSADSHSNYRCRTVHHVTGDTVESSSQARLVVTGKFPTAGVPTRLSDLFKWNSEIRSASALHVTRAPKTSDEGDFGIKDYHGGKH